MDRFEETLKAVLASIADERRADGGSRWNPPDAEAVVVINERLRWLAFPSFFGPRTQDLSEHVAGVLKDVAERLEVEVARAFAHEDADPNSSSEIVMAFLETVPTVRAKLWLDEQAAFGGDPAAHHVDEAILCHPGISGACGPPLRSRTLSPSACHSCRA